MYSRRVTRSDRAKYSLSLSDAILEQSYTSNLSSSLDESQFDSHWTENSSRHRRVVSSPRTRLISTPLSPANSRQLRHRVRTRDSQRKKNSKKNNKKKTLLHRKHKTTFDDIDWNNPTKATIDPGEMETKKLCMPYQSDLSYISLQIQQRLDLNSVERRLVRSAESSPRASVQRASALLNHDSPMRKTALAPLSPRLVPHVTEQSTKRAWENIDNTNKSPSLPTIKNSVIARNSSSSIRSSNSSTKHTMRDKKSSDVLQLHPDGKTATIRENSDHIADHFSVEDCFVEFSKFCTRIPAHGSGFIDPQLRRLTWVLPMVEVLYNKRWLVEQHNFADDTTAPAFSMPIFVFSSLAEEVGLQHMIHEVCWDLLYSVLYYRAENEELETFSNFLGEVYNNDDLMIFLHTRAMVQKRLGINLSSKHKLLDGSISKLFLPQTIVPMTEAHPQLREGTQRLFLTRTACMEVAIELFEDKGLAGFFIRRDVDPMLQRHVESGHMAGAAVAARVPVAKFLELMLLEFRSAPEALVEMLKYGNVAKNIEILNQLQQSSQKEELVVSIKEELASYIQSMKQAKTYVVKLETNPPRKKAEMSAHQVQLRLAHNRLAREERKVCASKQALKSAEEETSGVWHIVLGDAAKVHQNSTRLLQQSGASPPVTDAIVRFIKHMEILYEKAKAGKTELEAYAETWRDQLKRLQKKYAKKMLKWFRRKKRERYEREQARARLNELRRLRDMKREKAERALMSCEEEFMHAYLLELARRQAELDEEGRQLYLRKLRARRRAWADEQFRRRQHAFQFELVRRWKIFRYCALAHRRRIKRTLAYYFGAPHGWRGLHEYIARARFAAVKLQVRFRIRQDKKRVEGIRRIFKLTLRVLRRTKAGVFSEWLRISTLWRNVRLMGVALNANNFHARFLQWRKSILYQRWQVKHGLTIMQAVTRGGLFRWRKKKEAAVKILQGFSRTHMAQNMLSKARRRNNRNRLVARKYLMKMMKRLLQRCVTSWAFVTRRSLLVKRRFLDYMSADLQSRFQRWRQFLKIIAKDRFDGATMMQSAWRKRQARILAAGIKQLSGAVRQIQRVYRGQRGRRLAAWRNRAERAALKVAARWRGYRGRSLFLKIKLAIVLEDVEHKRYSRVKEHFKYDRAWLLDEDGNNLLMIAARMGSKRIVKICLRNGMDSMSYNRRGKTALHLAATSYSLGADTVTDYLCEKGVDVNFQDYKGNTALMDAAQKTNISTINTLIDWGADTTIYNNAGHNALHIAVLANRTGPCRVLCENGVDPNGLDYEYKTPLHMCAQNDLDMIGEILVEYGADLEAKDPEGYLPLHYAAVASNLKALEMLLQCGANPDAKDRQDWAVLHYAANNNLLEVGNILCDADADINLKDRDGDRPLHVAIAKHHQPMVELFCGYGANVNAQNADGLTPLHLAAKENNLDAAEVLLTYDLEVNVKDYQGNTALGVARLHRHLDIVQILKNRYESTVQEVETQDPEILNFW